MRQKKRIVIGACLLAILTCSVVTLHAASLLDTAKFALAKATSTKPKIIEQKKTARSAVQQLAHLSADDWKLLRAHLALLTKKSLKNIPSLIKDAQDLSAAGNRISITLKSMPAKTNLRFQGNVVADISPTTGVLYGLQGTYIDLSFPVTPGGVYLASCSGVYETDYAFYGWGNSGYSSYGGSASPISNGTTHMIWIAPSTVNSGTADLELMPKGSWGGYTEVFIGCDILRVL